MVRKLLVIWFFLLSCSAVSLAQVRVSSDVFAEVIEALTSNENAYLHFGQFSPESTGGEITVTPDGLRLAEGTVILSSGSFSAGQFAVSGLPEASISIQLPEGPAVLQHEQSNHTLQVDDWTSNPANGEHVTLQSDGSLLISIGATLYVGSQEDNPIGLYRGTYQVTFAYN